MSTQSDDPKSFEVTVRSDRSIITVEGQRDAAIMVRSESGERIYLPPEDAVKGEQSENVTSPYQSGDDEDDGVSSPYDRADAEDGPPSPYERGDDQTGDSAGRSQMPAGIRIIHPEPVTDFRVLR